MPPSLAPAPFYGDNLASLDAIRRIRFSRLFDSDNSVISRKTTSPKANQRFKGVKLFANISHGVKKAKLKNPKPLKKTAVQQVTKTKPAVSVREKMRDKFDFSRTPYSLSMRKPRVILTEEKLKNRKFFKTTVETNEKKKPSAENNSTIMEFEDLNDPEDEPFAEIKKGVSNILHQIDWFDDEDYLKPQVTRQVAEADESLNVVSTPNKSYITLANLSPRTPLLNNVQSVRLQTPSISSRDNQENSPASIPYSSTCEQTSNADQSKKLFPLFTPSSKKVLSDVTNKNKKQKNILNKAAAPIDQYQIDAGQNIIGPKQCTSCGVVFDIGDPIDAQRHDEHHNKRKEIRFKNIKSENVVGICGTDCIILVKPSDMKKRNKVNDVLKITEEEIGTGYAFESSFMAFLYIRNQIVLGCLIAEPNVMASRIIHSDGILLLSEDKQSVKCGINRVWVKSEFRGQKIATELMNCLSTKQVHDIYSLERPPGSEEGRIFIDDCQSPPKKNFIFGEILNIDDIAFSITTPDGDAFAIKYCGRHDYLSYMGTYSK